MPVTGIGGLFFRARGEHSEKLIFFVTPAGTFSRNRCANSSL